MSSVGEWGSFTFTGQVVGWWSIVLLCVSLLSTPFGPICIIIGIVQSRIVDYRYSTHEQTDKRPSTVDENGLSRSKFLPDLAQVNLRDGSDRSLSTQLSPHQLPADTDLSLIQPVLVAQQPETPVILIFPATSESQSFEVVVAMAAINCSSARCSPASKLSHSPGFSPLPGTGGARPSISACKAVDSRDFSAEFSVSSSTKGYGVCGRSKAFSGFCTASLGAGARQDVASSSSGWGSGGSSFLLGDCGHSRSSWNGVVFSPSQRKSGRGQGKGQNGHQCRVTRSRAQDEAATVKEIADLSESILNLKGTVTSEYRAIGPEMRGRVDRLYDRAIVLQQSADRAVKSGSGIPTQLTANLIALQREHGSLENIVRLAMEASPALASLEAAVSRSNTLSDAASNLLLEEAKPKPKPSIFQSLIRQSDLEPVKTTPPKYAMSAPASQGSSPLAAFRAEIERRVIEQLSGKKINKPVTPPSLGLPLSDSSLPTSHLPQAETRLSGGTQALANEQTTVEILEVLEENNGQLPTLSAEEAVGTVTLLENKLKQLELELAKSLPLQVFEQKVGNINAALSDARAEVVQLTAEVAEKEAILTAVKKDMLAEQEQLMQKVRELTGDLEKSYSVEDIEAAVNFGLEDLEKELEEEQDRTFLLSIELEKKEKFIIEQQENWRIMKEEMEKQLESEQDRALRLSLELETKEKQMIEQEDVWKVEKMALEADLKNITVKLQDVRRKRTKERAQLAEKKQKVKLLDQELVRLQENMEEADRIRLKKKEATHATVRMLITQMVQSSRARADSEAHASSLVQEVAKLQEENQVLEHSTRAAEEKAGQAEIEIEGIRSSLAKVEREVANLQGESSLGQRAAALEKFFGIMAKLIKQESESMEDSSSLSLDADFASDNEHLEDEELQMTPEDSLASAADDWDQDIDDQSDSPEETIR